MSTAQQSFRLEFAERFSRLSESELAEFEDILDAMPERELELLCSDLRWRQEQCYREPALV